MTPAGLRAGFGIGMVLAWNMAKYGGTCLRVEMVFITMLAMNIGWTTAEWYERMMRKKEATDGQGKLPHAHRRPARDEQQPLRGTAGAEAQ